MDVTDIGKVASRKRMNADAEKLRDKVSRETAKIIKLKVAQDTAYWDLKERLQQLQGAHERLQQNMLDVQMQHEAASAQYALERRLRPDALARAAGARALCSALEAWGARLRAGVGRARADRAALHAAYLRAGAAVRTLAADLARARHHCSAQRQQARAVSARARGAEGALTHARAELARLVARLDAQADEARRGAARREREAGEARAAAERLRREADEAREELRRARGELANSEKTIDLMKQKEATLIDKIKNLEKLVSDKSQHEQDLETEINSTKQSVRQLEADKLEAREQLEESSRACGSLRAELQQRAADLAQLRERLDQLQRELQARRDEGAAAAAAAARAADAHTATVARLMADLRAESDARARADAALAAARRAHDDELAAQMAVIRELRADKERLQERIQGMQNTIDNIQKELTGRPAAPKACGADEAPEPGPRPAELYSFLSDGSVDGDALDPREVGRRFRALASGGGRLRAQADSISLSQVKDDLKIKSRTFFKNKRFDSKPKKLQ